MNEKALFSHGKDNYETPQYLFDELNNEFNFTLDVCANKENAKCSKYFTKEDDGLKHIWHGVCWMNPPYGYGIKKWIEKAYLSSKNNEEVHAVVCLVPARTDTRWWHDYCMKGEIRFIKGRLKFNNAKTNAPFPSAVVVFKK